MKRVAALIAAGSLLATGLVTAQYAGAAPKAKPASAPSLSVYTGDLTVAQFAELRAAGLDEEDIASGPAKAGKTRVEVVMVKSEARKLIAKGMPLAEKKVGGQPVSRALAAQGRAAAAAPSTVPTASRAASATN